MKVSQFYMGCGVASTGFAPNQKKLVYELPSVTISLQDFVAQDNVTINIRKICVIDKLLVIFYEDKLPVLEKNGDRFAGLDV
jgi:hypothetical protein